MEDPYIPESPVLVVPEDLQPKPLPTQPVLPPVTEPVEPPAEEISEPTEEVYVVSAKPSAVVTRLNGAENLIEITIVESLSDGTENVLFESFRKANNSDNTFVVGSYEVYVSVRGNTQIREIRLG